MCVLLVSYVGCVRGGAVFSEGYGLEFEMGLMDKRFSSWTVRVLTRRKFDRRGGRTPLRIYLSGIWESRWKFFKFGGRRWLHQKKGPATLRLSLEAWLAAGVLRTRGKKVLANDSAYRAGMHL